MNKLVLVLVAIGFFIGLCSLELKKGDEPNQIISKDFIRSVKDFNRSMVELKVALEKGTNQKEMLRAYFTCREEYKQFEYLYFYLFPHDAEYFVNGAPLPKLTIDTDNPKLSDPKGLQVMDELAVDLKTKESREEMLEQLKMLQKRFEPIASSRVELIYDRQIFEAMRTGIVFITTLGISGFDTPGTARGIHESRVMLESIKDAFFLYSDQLTEVDFTELNATKDLFNEGIRYCEGDFDDFDRFTFTRDYLNPISSNLLKAQEALHIEFRDEVESVPNPVNHRSPHLFASDYFDDRYFIRRSGKKQEELTSLGRTLFFDPILSANNERSCASCHNPKKAFSEDLPKSMAFDFQGNIERNAMTLANSIYAEKFFYDLRAGDLFTQFEHVVFNESEFNTDYQAIVSKLNSCEEYVEKFREVSGKDEIQKEDVNLALTAYVSSLRSSNSAFDKMIRNELEAESEVIEGYNLFMGKAKCGTCHFPPTFAGLRPPFYRESESEVIGVTKTEDLDDPELDPDHGRRASGRVSEDIDFYDHSFKTVTVRNAAITAPYFHNGAFSTLEKVLEFYNEGGGAGLGLDLPNQTLPFDSLNLSQQEQAQIITFLHSLTDIEGMTIIPEELPACSSGQLSERVVGGKY